MFYPRITAAELAMWNHWLPTTFVYERHSQQSRQAFYNRLGQLRAPEDVVQECQWAWTMDLFEAYELKLPIRQDLRDPLVLGRLGTQHYRLALWGESLRPLAEIHDFVQQSLQLRQRAVRWLWGSLASGAFVGLVLGLWIAGQTSYEGDQLGVSLACAALGSFCLGFPFYTSTPENKQQHFLDRYRC
jgi:hypothetical protein